MALIDSAWAKTSDAYLSSAAYYKYKTQSDSKRNIKLHLYTFLVILNGTFLQSAVTLRLPFQNSHVDNSIFQRLLTV
jgi:hypothetical protein